VTRRLPFRGLFWHRVIVAREASVMSTDVGIAAISSKCLGPAIAGDIQRTVTFAIDDVPLRSRSACGRRWRPDVQFRSGRLPLSEPRRHAPLRLTVGIVRNYAERKCVPLYFQAVLGMSPSWTSSGDHPNVLCGAASSRIRSNQTSAYPVLRPWWRANERTAESFGGSQNLTSQPTTFRKGCLKNGILVVASESYSRCHHAIRYGDSRLAEI
jgi:hypothetical protein